jgi:hypothetical protein
MGLIREGLMTVCEAALWVACPRSYDLDRISAADEETPRLAINGLPLSPEL